MWQLIQVEFRYAARSIIYTSTLIVVGSLMYFRVSSTASVTNILFPLTTAIIIQVVIHRSLEKRDRRILMLPFSLRQLATVRIMLVWVPCLIIHVLFFGLFIAFHDLSPRWQFDIFELLMFFGVILLGFAIYFIIHDKAFDLIAKLKKNSPELIGYDLVVLITVISVVCLCVPLLFAALKGNVANSLRFSCFIAGIAILYPAVLTFEKRKSYLD